MYWLIEVNGCKYAVSGDEDDVTRILRYLADKFKGTYNFIDGKHFIELDTDYSIIDITIEDYVIAIIILMTLLIKG